MNRVNNAAAAGLALCAATPIVLGLPDPIAETHRLVAADPAECCELGAAVDIDGARALVGGQRADCGAYVFDIQSGAQLANLRPKQPSGAYARFGSAVAIAGDIALIAAPSANDTVNEGGAVYVFDIPTGAELRRLVPAEQIDYQDNFGTSVDLDGDTAAIGWGFNSNSVSIFDVPTGIERLVLSPDEPTTLFGQSVAISGNRVLVGGDRSAFIFDLLSGEQLHRLVPERPEDARSFGESVAMDAGVAVVGSGLSNKDGRPTNTGLAFIFDAETGQQTARLEPPNGVADGANFGKRVDIDGDTILIDTGWDEAYLIDAANSRRVATLRKTEVSTSGASFAAAIADVHALLGERYYDAPGVGDAGAAYLFRLPCSPADLAGPTGVLDLADVVSFVRAFAEGDEEADLATDGVIDAVDIDAYIAAFLAGCP